jgi:hypothetical protein
MKLGNSNIIYQTGGINFNYWKLIICGSSQKEKIECKKQENDIKSALETSLDDINKNYTKDISMNDEELEKELKELTKEKKLLSKEEVARQMKELELEVENNMSEVSNNPLDRQLFKMTADNEKELEDELNKLTLGGGGKLLNDLINSYVEIEKLKIAEINKGQRIKQLIKEALALKEQWENAKLTTDKSRKKSKLIYKLTLKKKEIESLKKLSKNIVMIETKNKNKIREFIKVNTTGLNQKQFDLKFHRLLSSIITKAQSVQPVIQTVQGGGGNKKIRKHRGIHQTGGKAGKLQKGYKYSGKRLKNGKAEIIKIKKSKK